MVGLLAAGECSKKGSKRCIYVARQRQGVDRMNNLACYGTRVKAMKPPPEGIMLLISLATFYNSSVNDRLAGIGTGRVPGGGTSLLSSPGVTKITLLRPSNTSVFDDGTRPWERTNRRRCCTRLHSHSCGSRHITHEAQLKISSLVLCMGCS